MILNALWITVIGMGGVFAFLILLIGGMVCLHTVVSKTNKQFNDKTAVAIALALAREN